MQELLLKLGMSGNITFKDKCKENSVYQIHILTDEEKDFQTPKYPRRTIERYDGLVYCVNVPNHVIFVRRNGKTLFCGNCYDEAKRCGEAFVVAYHLQHGLDTRIIRIFNSYGPRMRAGDVYGRVIPRFIDQALTNAPITVFGDGTQTRAFTYVTDMINGLLRAGLMPTAKGQVINIGNNVETQIIQLAQLIKNLAKSNSPIKFYPLPIADPERRCPDITKAQQLIGLQPTTSLEHGLKATIEWFKKTARH
jgi:nucleoside-diphosphate-sugar epimerase